jgi:hypothetical protein
LGAPKVAIVLLANIQLGKLDLFGHVQALKGKAAEFLLEIAE